MKISVFGTIPFSDLIKEGLNHCSGDIICLLDADDYFINTKIYFIHHFKYQITNNQAK